MDRIVTLLMGVLLVGGCAPSVRMMHQNAEYFERCQAADYDPSVSMDARHACWSRWLAHYTEAQPAERIRHARARLTALEADEAVEPLPGIDGLVVDAAHAPAHLPDEGAAPAEPATDAAIADDPETMEQARNDAATDARPSDTVDDVTPTRRPPRHRRSACSDACLPGWERCVAACADRGDACIKSCEAEHRVCVAACP